MVIITSPDFPHVSAPFSCTHLWNVTFLGNLMERNRANGLNCWYPRKGISEDGKRMEMEMAED